MNEMACGSATPQPSAPRGNYGLSILKSHDDIVIEAQNFQICQDRQWDRPKPKICRGTYHWFLRRYAHAFHDQGKWL